MGKTHNVNFGSRLNWTVAYASLLAPARERPLEHTLTCVTPPSANETREEWCEGGQTQQHPLLSRYS